MNDQRDVWYHVGEWTGWLFTWVLGVAVIGGAFVLIVVGLVMMSGCGGEGGNVGGGEGATLATGTTPDGGTTLVCDLGSNNSFSFTVGDNASLNICTLNGGTVTPDNSTISQPTDSNNRTTNNVNPTPTPGSTG